MFRVETPTEISQSWQENEIRVLLIDDQPLVAQSLQAMLAPEPMALAYLADPMKALEIASILQPTVILLDLIMPEIDGMTLVRFFKAHLELQDIPLIVLSSREDAITKARAFELGAHDYLVKLPERIELVARLRHHSKGYTKGLQRDQAFQALEASRKELASELHHASEYIRALLPPPMQGRVKADWRFIPSAALGGDSFGYHWLDADHLGIYLLDVCGHGVASALLSISAINTLRAQNLTGTDFRNPGSVLSALNLCFPMERHNSLFFSIWYATYHVPTRTLDYASAGHPPGMLVSGKGSPIRLATPAMVIGALPDSTYPSTKVILSRHSRLYLFSDGVFEIFDPDGQPLEFSRFESWLVEEESDETLDKVVSLTRGFRGTDQPEDDYSMMELYFP